MEAKKAPAVGTKLGGRYRLVFGRGEGPSGIVFKALDLALDLPVAVKVFRPELFTSGFSEQNLFRLYRARTFQDPSVVKIQEVQDDGGVHFLTSTLIEGMSLRHIIDLHEESGESFPLPKVRSFAQRMFDCVSSIHRAGAIHGNIKPENFFILPDRLVTSDPFHLVIRPLAEGDQIPVSDYYRGPEQLSDPAMELIQTDVYALALILGEILATSPVQPGVPLSGQVPRLTRRLDDLFLSATAEDPSQRPATVDAFAEAFRQILAVVEQEGLFVRRGHETGSFRAIRLARGPGDESGVTPLPTILAPVPVLPAESQVPEAAPVRAQAGSVEPPQPPPEALVEEIADYAVEEFLEAEPALTGSFDASAGATQPYDDDKTQIAAMVFAGEDPQTEAALIEEELLLLEPEEADGIEVAPSNIEDVVEGIEVFGDNAPPLPLDNEALFQEPPPMPAEAIDGTLEVESLYGVERYADQKPARPMMAPFEKVQGQQALSKRAAKKASRTLKQPPYDGVGDVVTPIGGVQQAPSVQRAADVPRPIDAPRASTDSGGATKAPAPVAFTPKSASSGSSRSATSSQAQGQKGGGSWVTFVVLLGLFVAAGGGAAALYLHYMEASDAAPPASTRIPESRPAATAPRPAAKPAAVVAEVATPTPTPVPAPAPAVVTAPTDAPAAIPATAGVPEAPAPAEQVTPPPPPAKVTLAGVLKCPSGMEKVVVDENAVDGPGSNLSAVAYCIDAYEYPGKGQRPKTGVAVSAATGICKKEGKRLCSAGEWLRACGEADPAPGACNVSGTIQEAGKGVACKTATGLFDMVGNAGELTSDGRLHGGDVGTGKAANCRFSVKHFMPKGTDGFRCCGDAAR
jgi:hypothetical protein